MSGELLVDYCHRCLGINVRVKMSINTAFCHCRDCGCNWQVHDRLFNQEYRAQERALKGSKTNV